VAARQHALTTALAGGHDPATLAEQTRSTVATYLACGLQPDERCTIFVQSHVRQHAELQCEPDTSRALGCFARA
jgi:tryptophanyl-tRNA synthetase